MVTESLSRKQRTRLNRRWIIATALAVLAIAVVIILATRPDPAAQAAAVNTIAVARGNIVGSISGSGTIVPDRSVDLVFQTTGIVDKVLVKDGDMVQAGQPLATIDDRTLQSQVAAAQAALDTSKAKLQQAQKGNATSHEVASAQAAVASAQAGYEAAVKSAQVGDSKLLSLKASLDKAQAAVQQAQAAYDRIGGASNPSIGMLPQSKDLQNASIDYQKAMADYQVQLKTSEPDAQSKILSAQATLQQAQANLAKLSGPASETDLAIQRAAVAQAEESLKQAQLNLERATLRAPFDGIVANVKAVVGSSSTGAAMTLIDRNPLRVDLRLSENDVVQAALGQTVKLTIDSLPEWGTEGTTTYIAPAAQINNGVVTYGVRVDFADTDPRVKAGMTANVDIVIAEKEGVLLVPNSALLPKGSGHIVQAIGKDGKIQEVEVQIGISDGSRTEIVSGLTDGQRIVALPGTGARSNNPFAPSQ